MAGSLWESKKSDPGVLKSAIVTSDLHLGSRFCRYEEFLAFLDALPAAVPLILNGDIVDAWRRLPEPHAAVLDRLRAVSLQRELIWIRGNNDRRLVLKEPGRIRFVESWQDGGALCVTHGHQFDRVLHGNPFFTTPFRVMYWIHSLRGTDPMHVGTYAKQWRWLYQLLLTHVVNQAVRSARKHGFGAIICGHTHQAEDLTLDGIRYVNTGSWTEDVCHYAAIDNGMVALRPVQEMLRRKETPI